MLDVFANDNDTELDRQVTLENLPVDKVLKDLDDDAPAILKDNPCLLAAAAYFAAEKCFRYLLLHGADYHVLDEVFSYFIRESFYLSSLLDSLCCRRW